MANDKNKKKQLFTEMIANAMGGKVGKMVFSQEDLEELLENEEREIYICADGIHIPLNYENTTYYGYNEPVVIIDSEKIVDFKTLGINIENCLFDEAYSKLLHESDVVEQRMEEGDYEENEMEEINEEYEDEMEEELDVQEFYDDMKEYFSDYREEIMGMKVSEDFDDFFNLASIDDVIYVCDGEYEYESKAKAKLACKMALDIVVDNTKTKILSCVSDYMSHTMIYFSDLSYSFEEFLKDLSNAYDSCASMDCEEEAKAYVMSKKNEFFAESSWQSHEKEITKEEIEKVVLKDLNKKISVRSLLQECEYDEYDDLYCYECKAAIDTISNIVEDLIYELEDTLPQQVYGAYRNIFIYVLNKLEEKFDEIFTE